VGSLGRRVERLEEHNREPIKPSLTQEAARAIDAQIRELEGELLVLGINPYECLRGASVDLPLDEEIARLEEELEGCRED
jgi:hypothetical protein